MSSKQNGLEPVFDRSKISHGESKKAAILLMRLEQAQKDGDIAAVTRLMDEIEAHTAKMIVYIPPGWFVDGAPAFDAYNTIEVLNWLRQDKYQDLIEAAKPKQAGETVA